MSQVIFSSGRLSVTEDLDMWTRKRTLAVWFCDERLKFVSKDDLLAIISFLAKDESWSEHLREQVGVK